MFIAHLPAGYITSRLLFQRFRESGISFRSFACAGMLGAVMPDIDLAYFFFFDRQQHHHHTFFTHFPILWASWLLLSALWLWAGKSKRIAAGAFIFSLNGFIHLILDSVVGEIWWLAPFVDRPFSLFSVQAVYKPWWLNFMFHWTFSLEIAICAWAFYLWRREGKI